MGREGGEGEVRRVEGEERKWGRSGSGRKGGRERGGHKGVEGGVVRIGVIVERYGGIKKGKGRGTKEN